MDKKQLLEWHIAAGVDEAIGDEPTNHFAQRVPAAVEANTGEPSPVADQAATLSPTAQSKASPLHHSPSSATAASRLLADSCQTLAELEAAVRGFDGCALKKTASKTVFSDGNPAASIMVIGEAPGAQEDMQGIPFCGPSGALLDKMLASIGLSRAQHVYISNTVFWRPPGNRQPSPEETAICLPLVEKHIALIRPSLLILCGGTATIALLQKDLSISRLRGKPYEYTNPYLAQGIKTMVTYHPSYLLRSPQQKKLAWQDLLMVKGLIKELNITI